MRIKFSKQDIKPLILALGIGAIGGTIAHYLAVPLAWMIGPLIANIITSMSGLPVAIPLQFRSVMLIIWGCFLGSTFSPDMISEIYKWPISLISVLFFVLIATAVSCAYYRRFAKVDAITALFAATPGGLTPMSILAGSLGGKEQYVAFLQGIRIVALVCITPLVVFGMLGEDASQQVGSLNAAVIFWDEVGLLLGTAIFGVFIATKLKIPAAYMTGAMFVSATLFLSGGIETDLPPIILEAALWVIGSAIGSRFRGYRLDIVKSLSLYASGNVLFLMVITLGAAWPISHYFGFEYLAVVLAFAPGGVAEMCLIALALNIDPSFVAFHHLARISLILLVTPAIATYMGRAKLPQNDKSQSE